MPHTMTDWESLVGSNTRGLTRPQIKDAAALSFHAEQNGVMLSAWHTAAMVTGRKCHCMDCENERGRLAQRGIPV